MHLSWNEWWEGSNLEPSREFGKTYCEKNLLYATLMKLAFDSIHNAEREAKVGVLLNDWRLASGSTFQEELYGTIQTLRRLCVPFDLVPDGLVTPEALDRFHLVLVPAYSSGLGYNAGGEKISEVLAKWLRTGPRRLIVSHHPSLAATFCAREVSSPPGVSNVRGDDMNVFIDVGAEGDERFLRSGYTLRETAVGVNPADPRSTFRWTPGVGNETSLLLPASTNRDHLLRVVGHSIWPNKVSLLINAREVKTIDMPAGDVRLEITVPAATIGATPVAALDLRFATMNVPSKKAPAQYPGEERVCNLMMESLQWSTANVPADTRKQQYNLAGDKVRLTGELLRSAGNRSVDVAVQPRVFFDTSKAEVLSYVERGGALRDVLLRVGPSEVIYVNGPLSEMESEAYWLPLVSRWANVEFHRFAMGERCMANRLRAGDTQFIVVFNEEIAKPRDVCLSIPSQEQPFSEAAVLTRDGKSYQQLAVSPAPDSITARDAMRYYGAYQFVFSPVKVETPALAIQPGERKKFSTRVTNLTSQPVHGQIQPRAMIPTVSGPSTPVDLQPKECKTVELEIAAAPTADWGKKTIYLELAFNSRRAVALRELVVEKLRGRRSDHGSPRCQEAQAAAPRAEKRLRHDAPLPSGRLTFAGHVQPLRPIEEGCSSSVSLLPIDVPPPDGPELRTERLRIELGEPRQGQVIEREVFLARMPGKVTSPSDAVAAVVVFNARSAAMENELVAVKLPATSGPLLVRSDAGREVPSQVDRPGGLRFLVDVPTRTGRTFYVCRGGSSSASDLRYSAEGLGTGKGNLESRSARMSVVLSESAGGTVTTLRSARTGRDYGRKSFGADYGTFSEHDPANPLTNTAEYIHEKKVRQEDRAGRDRADIERSRYGGRPSHVVGPQGGSRADVRIPRRPALFHRAVEDSAARPGVSTGACGIQCPAPAESAHEDLPRFPR